MQESNSAIANYARHAQNRAQPTHLGISQRPAILRTSLIVLRVAGHDLNPRPLGYDRNRGIASPVKSL